MQLEVLVKEFLFECEIREYTDKTVENYRKQLRHFLTFMSNEFQISTLEELKPLHVKAFIKHYQLRQCKPSYVNDNLKAVKVLCAYAYREKYTDYLITKNIKNVKEPKSLIHTFSPEEIKKMISYYSGGNYMDIRNKTKFTFYLRFWTYSAMIDYRKVVVYTTTTKIKLSLNKKVKTLERPCQQGSAEKVEPQAKPNEWGFSCKMLDLTRHIDSVRNA